MDNCFGLPPVDQIKQPRNITSCAANRAAPIVRSMLSPVNSPAQELLG